MEGSKLKRAGADDQQANSASLRARAAGDFGTQCMQEHQVIFVVANSTLVTRMFISLGLNNEIVDAIVDEHGYNTPRHSVVWTKSILSSLSLPSANLVE